jgi:hypothetical protein
VPTACLDSFPGRCHHQDGSGGFERRKPDGFAGATLVWPGNTPAGPLAEQVLTERITASSHCELPESSHKPEEQARATQSQLPNGEPEAGRLRLVSSSAFRAAQGCQLVRHPRLRTPMCVLTLALGLLKSGRYSCDRGDASRADRKVCPSSSKPTIGEEQN